MANELIVWEPFVYRERDLRKFAVMGIQGGAAGEAFRLKLTAGQEKCLNHAKLPRKNGKSRFAALAIPQNYGHSTSQKRISK